MTNESPKESMWHETGKNVVHRLMSYEELSRLLRTAPKIMDYNSLTQAISRQWKQILKDSRAEDEELDEYSDY